MTLRLFTIAHPVSSLGPGLRAALWTAGCSLRCPGCLSPELRDPNAGKSVPVSLLARHLAALPREIRGLTLTGGEPFDQAPALTRLLAILHETRPEWDVMAYSGYTLPQLQAMPETSAVLDLVDILVDGPYQAKKPPRHILAGSGNQAIHPLSGKGRMLARDMAAEPAAPAADLALGAGDIAWKIGVPQRTTPFP